MIFAGQAFGEDRSNLFAGADVFVHPSRWEGLSLSVLAAAAAGKPCLITRDADPLGELERAQAAILVDANVESIADGLRRAAVLPGENCWRWALAPGPWRLSKFDWPTIASTARGRVSKRSVAECYMPLRDCWLCRCRHLPMTELGYGGFLRDITSPTKPTVTERAERRRASTVGERYDSPLTIVPSVAAGEVV